MDNVRWISLKTATDLWLDVARHLRAGAEWKPGKNIEPVGFARLLESAYCEAAYSSRIHFKGAKLTTPHGDASAPEVIDSYYFHELRTFVTRKNRIDPQHDLHSNERWNEARDGGETNPIWIDVRVLEAEFKDWLEQWMHEQLVEEIATGAKSPNDAEALLRELKLTPLYAEPNPRDFESGRDPYWTIAMAVAWIATGSLEAVARTSPAFNELRREWRGSKGARNGQPVHGLLLEKPPPVTLITLCDELIESWGITVLKSVIDAKQALDTAMRSGKLEAFGRNGDSAPIAPIPKLSWLDAPETGDLKRDQFGPWLDVVVEVPRVLELFPDERTIAKPAPRRPQRVRHKAAEVTKFIENLFDGQALDELPLNDDRVVELARQEFPNIDRDQVRRLRSEVFPDDFRKRGNRKTVRALLEIGGFRSPKAARVKFQQPSLKN